jgi:hypothetical protein
MLWSGARARDNAVAAGLEVARTAKGEPRCRGVGQGEPRIERLEADLAKHTLALDIAGEAHALLEMLAESATDDTTTPPPPGSKPKR